MNVFKKIIKDLFKKSHSDTVTQLDTPHDATIKFVLTYRRLPIGYLELHDGKWFYMYTDEFRNQHDLHTIVGFPDLNKTYEDDDLWPFFASRIPSTATPFVEKRVKKKNLNPENPVDMLKEFGQRTITNPFELAEV